MGPPPISARGLVAQHSVYAIYGTECQNWHSIEVRQATKLLSIRCNLLSVKPCAGFCEAGMKFDTPRCMLNAQGHLARHLAWIVAIKVAALVAIWFFLIRDASPPVSAESAAAHMAATTNASKKSQMPASLKGATP